jgi:hypothetical protein
MPWPFVTSKSLRIKTMTHKRNTKRTNSNHFQLTQRTKKEWTERGVMEEYCVDDDLEQRNAPHASLTCKNFPSTLKQESKHVQESKFRT